MGSELLIAIGTGAGLSAASLSHCALMCGPIASHAAARRGVRGYLLGRLVSYTLLGALAGSVGHLLGQLGPARWVEAVLSWSIAATLGLSAARLLWPGRPREPLLQLSQKAAPSTASRVLAQVAFDPLLLGVATALLPCGVLLAAVLAAAAQRSALAGALMMATFSVVSGTALFGVAQLASRLALREHGKRALGVVLAAGAVLLILRPIPSLTHNEMPACHGTHTTEKQ